MDKSLLFERTYDKMPLGNKKLINCQWSMVNGTGLLTTLPKEMGGLIKVVDNPVPLTIREVALRYGVC